MSTDHTVLIRNISPDEFFAGVARLGLTEVPRLELEDALLRERVENRRESERDDRALRKMERLELNRLVVREADLQVTRAKVGAYGTNVIFERIQPDRTELPELVVNRWEEFVDAAWEPDERWLAEERDDIRKCVAALTNDRWLTDGRDVVPVSAGKAELRVGNSPSFEMIDSIAKVFAVEFYTEHEPQYWGFDTQEDWDAAMEAIGKEQSDRFYVELIKYVNGQPNDIRPRTHGEVDAKIAKELIAQRPELGLPNAKEELLSAIEHYL